MRLQQAPVRSTGIVITGSPAGGPSLRREQRRLRHVFTALLAALAPAAGVQACGDEVPVEVPPGSDAGTGGGASSDAGTDADTGAQADADAGADADVPADADASIEDAPAKDCKMKTTLLDADIDADPGCLYTLPCGLALGLKVVGCQIYTGADIPLACTVEEGYGCLADAYAPGPDGEVHIICVDCLGGGGRRPSGLARPRGFGATTAAGAYFARMAHDEAASVHAFRRMRDELSRHGAPAELLEAAERSARDEVRHARVMARRARALGAPIPPVRVRRPAPRTLAAIARENAVEGCVHETFGALLATWQAAHARDASLRRAFTRIAADETRHAALAWAAARWMEERLTPAERTKVAAARARAVRALGRCARAAAFDGEVGRPGPRERAALLAGMVERLGV